MLRRSQDALAKSYELLARPIPVVWHPAETVRRLLLWRRDGPGSQGGLGGMARAAPPARRKASETQKPTRRPLFPPN